MWILALPQLVAVAAMIWFAFSHPFGGGFVMLGVAFAIGLAIWGFLKVTSPSLDSATATPLERAYSEFFVALNTPFASQYLSRGYALLTTACVLLIPLELWKGAWWLAVLAPIPAVLFSHATARLNPWQAKRNGVRAHDELIDGFNQIWSERLARIDARARELRAQDQSRSLVPRTKDS
jgi:hypothetical protein